MRGSTYETFSSRTFDEFSPTVSRLKQLYLRAIKVSPFGSRAHIKGLHLNESCEQVRWSGEIIGNSCTFACKELRARILANLQSLARARHARNAILDAHGMYSRWQHLYSSLLSSVWIALLLCTLLYAALWLRAKRQGPERGDAGESSLSEDIRAVSHIHI